jgi:hypothetical protein
MADDQPLGPCWRGAVVTVADLDVCAAHPDTKGLDQDGPVCLGRLGHFGELRRISVSGQNG